MIKLTSCDIGVYILTFIICFTFGTESLDIYKIFQSKPLAEHLLEVDDPDEVIFKGYVHDFVMLSCGMLPDDDNTKVCGMPAFCIV